MDETPIDQTAKLIASADHLLITAGAGMGVDSVFLTESKGFWQAFLLRLHERTDRKDRTPRISQARIPFEDANVKV